MRCRDIRDKVRLGLGVRFGGPAQAAPTYLKFGPDLEQLAFTEDLGLEVCLRRHTRGFGLAIRNLGIRDKERRRIAECWTFQELPPGSPRVRVVWLVQNHALPRWESGSGTNARQAEIN
jgi:hypothetical protein